MSNIKWKDGITYTTWVSASATTSVALTYEKMVRAWVKVSYTGLTPEEQEIIAQGMLKNAEIKENEATLKKALGINEET